MVEQAPRDWTESMVGNPLNPNGGFRGAQVLKNFCRGDSMTWGQRRVPAERRRRQWTIRGWARVAPPRTPTRLGFSPKRGSSATSRTWRCKRMCFRRVKEKAKTDKGEGRIRAGETRRQNDEE